MIVLVTGIVGLLTGTVLGWASRAHAHWCRACGAQLRCPVHDQQRTR